MTAAPDTWSPSVSRALQWAGGLATLGGRDGTISPDDLFLGLLLAHPDDEGEVWCFLAHFDLTARDLLPDDYPAIDHKALQVAAAAAPSTPDPERWNVEISSVLAEAGTRTGSARVANVLASILALTSWIDRLGTAISRSGVSAGQLVPHFRDECVPELKFEGPRRAGLQIRDWLAERYPRRRATMPSFSNDRPDPSADFIGVGEEADAFAYLIASKALVPPLAVGMFGSWGSGKSFLMARIRQRVEQLSALAAAADAAGGATAGTSAPDGAASGSTQVWPNVVSVEFNAWQYVETDLWAALLARIFEQLSPEARRRLSEFSRVRERAEADREAALEAARQAEQVVAERDAAARTALAKAEATKQEESQVAHDAEQVRARAVEAALDAHARTAAGTAVVDAVAGAMGSDVADAVGEVRRLRTQSADAPWRQGRFWSRRRVVWATIAALVVPLVTVLLAVLDLGLPVAVTAAITTGAAVLTPMLRSAANYRDEQRSKVDEALQKVETKLAQHEQKARQARVDAEKAADEASDALRTATEEAEAARAIGIDVERIAAGLTPAGVLADRLAERRASDDYRKRLGIVSTVADDLEKLSSLIADYNASVFAGEHPPGERPGDVPPNRIVLYIDDLDRCPPQRVVEVLEAVNLLLAFPLFVVVVAVDTRWLTSALAKAMPTLKTDGGPLGHAPTPTDYVEKIFQIPFWIDPLDETGRHRLLRGLLVPSVRPAEGGAPPPQQEALRAGEGEFDTVDRMVAVRGAGLDLDARDLTITPDEFSFIEGLNSLLTGTPREVKRFVNVCKLLLAMSPPLEGGTEPTTERKAACFLAALSQARPTFAARLAAAATAAPSADLDTLVSNVAGAGADEDATALRSWLAAQPVPAPPAQPVGSMSASALLKRWEMIRRLRFTAEPA
ncbi:P-loop NTPase fold protein [Agromyces binzhouensis]|uniref:P-loop NTPase fold protein n=1 Tax=Agromyces binzhouensis TaxID=1817495 RepID=UPI00363C9FFF